MDIEKILKQFLVIAEQRSLGAAAPLLHVSQSSLTKNIKKLEQSYNAPLFKRHSKGMQLTEFGEVLYKRCINIEREFQYAKREIEILRHGKNEHLVIGLGISYSLLISPVLEQFYKRFPNMRVSIVSGSVTDLLPPLVAGKIDFILGGVHNVNFDDFGVTFEHIMDTNHCIIVRKQHPLAHKPTVDPVDLQLYPWIEFQYSDDQAMEIHDFLAKNNQPPANIMLQTNFLRTALAFLNKGDYLMNIPRLAVSQIEKNMVTLNLNVPFLSFASGAFFIPDTGKIPYIRTCLEYIHQEIEEKYTK